MITQVLQQKNTHVAIEDLADAAETTTKNASQTPNMTAAVKPEYNRYQKWWIE